MWILALFGCGVGEWAWDRYMTEPKPTPVVSRPTPVTVAPPKPITPPAPARGDSRPPPLPSPISAGSCGDLTDGGPVGADGVTATIQCNQTIIGHTKGGVERFDTRWYERNFCTPGTTDHDSGDERIYRLEVPDSDWVAFVDLYSPCADLDAAGMWVQGDNPPVPGPATENQHCDMPRVKGHQDERLTLASQHRGAWYIIVEGVDNQEGLFALTVQCRPGLH